MPWRDVLPVYAPWQTLYRWFRRWTWTEVLAALQAVGDAAGNFEWTVSVDSTVSRAHQHAAGARRDGHVQREPPGGVQDEPADHGLGRSRGGFTTKTHLACERGRKTLAVVVTAGQRGDSPQFVAVLERITVRRAGGGRSRTLPDLVLADKAYTSKGNRGYARRRGIRVCIPSKAHQDAHRKAKGVQRRTAARLRPDRLPAAARRGVRHQPTQTTPRHGHPLRLAVRFEATVVIAAISQWLRALRNSG
ncbi:IS5 family transposase [Dactylosporangium matsuzakiense]|uniref:DDE transposase n=1 Tax=Dactylosporangium matsuzakiense TaxID=53360 RepID=A0A9W6KH30_9ACTN|nr:DDE transposase [Dactylosporangium matsuzakiense]